MTDTNLPTMFSRIEDVVAEMDRELATAERTLEAALKLKAVNSPLFTEAELDDMIESTAKTIESIKARK